MTSEHPNSTSGPAWVPGPLNPVLGAGSLHVWRVDLTRVPDALLEVLSPQEHERAQRFIRQPNGRLWARARAVLRLQLAGYLQKHPATLRLAATKHGKPVLDDARLSRLSFNVSHSGTLALTAFTEIGAVGVDVEFGGGSLNEVGIAARVLGRETAVRLRGLGPRAREREFLRCWSLHEAETKWRGSLIDAAGAPGSEPWIASLDIGPHGAAAVATDRRPRELRAWDWGVEPRDPPRVTRRATRQ